MTLDDWNSILKLGSGLALALTFSVGVAALLVGHALGKRQALLIAEAKREAALANEGLAKSNEEIARLNAVSATASRDAAQATAGLAQSNAEIARLTVRAAELSRETEVLKKSRIELEARVAFRRLPSVAQNAFAAKLAAFAGQSAGVWYNAGDHEGSVFAADIAKALKMSRWDVFAPASLIHFAESGRRGEIEPVKTGVEIASTGDEASRKAADAVLQELVAAGFDANRNPKVEERRPPIVLVTVEARPEGPQGDMKLAAIREGRK